MNINPEVNFFFNTRKLSPTEGLTNSVLIIFDAKSTEIFHNPTTGYRIFSDHSTPVSSSRPVNFSLRSLNRHHILWHLRNQLTSHTWLRIRLASVIERLATTSGFGRNGFHLKIDVEITYKTVVVMSNDEELRRMVLLGKGKIGREELKSLKKETEPCSICLEKLSGSKPGIFATRMICSHVFHDRCLREWLEHKNTCPLCRTVLYDL